MKRRIIIGISGASGAIYGIRALMHLRAIDAVESHLILTDSAATTISLETDYSLEQVRALADVVHRNENIAASIASGSYIGTAMAILPCSIRTLSAVALSRADNLIARAADVVLKEQRKLVLAVRETPLHKGHLELMVKAADIGATILPPMPAFYHDPQTIDDIVDHTVGKVFDMLDIEHRLFRRWGDPKSRTPV